MIQLKNIHLQFKEQLLLENESLDINEGYIHVIMGESGSGKTTLLYEISLLSSLSNMVYLWNDQRIDGLNDFEKSDIRRNHIGYILQDLELISEDLSLRDNLECMFALSNQEYNQEKVNEYMEKMNLNCSLEQQVHEMSRGERQRFALVLALIKDVELIVCDEPTSALDKDNTMELMKYLHMIARDYHKMIVIATHDSYVEKEADILYRIENKHLICERKKAIKNVESTLKNINSLNKRFYKIYKKSYKKTTQMIMNTIYVVMIVMICLLPMILDLLLDKQEKLYDLYADKEIIVVNTKERTPNVTYNESYPLFNNNQVHMLKEIEHIQDVDYYWEMKGIVSLKDESKEVVVIPKRNIDNIVFSTTLSKKIDNQSLQLSFNYQDYEFEIKTDDYDIKDYPTKQNIKNEVVYIPYEQMLSILKTQGIKESSALSIICDDVDNIEKTTTEIQRWLTSASISSNGLRYKEQIDYLKTIKEFIEILRIVMIIVILAVAYMIQTMENKSRLGEITNLRINGFNKKLFYQLYDYENRTVMILTFICCLLGYILLTIIFDIRISMINVVIIMGESIMYMIITRIIPLFISVQQIFKKDISTILRENN